MTQRFNQNYYTYKIRKQMMTEQNQEFSGWIEEMIISFISFSRKQCLPSLETGVLLGLHRELGGSNSAVRCSGALKCNPNRRL